MKLARTSTTAGVIFAAVLIGTTVAGCGGDKDKDSKSDSSSSSSSSTSSSTAAETTSSAASTPAAEGTDYSALLIKASDIDPSFIVTHRMSLDDASQGYETFKHKQDDCVKVVMTP